MTVNCLLKGPWVQVMMGRSEGFKRKIGLSGSTPVYYLGSRTSAELELHSLQIPDLKQPFAAPTEYTYDSHSDILVLCYRMNPI